MPEYLKQTDHYSCGVIASMNLDIWREKKVSHRDFTGYRKALKCDTKRGMERPDFSKWIGFRPTKLNWPKLKKHLQSGGAAVVFTKKCMLNQSVDMRFLLIV